MGRGGVREVGRRLAALAMLVAGVLLVLALASFDSREVAARSYPAPSGPGNLLGARGVAAVFFVMRWVGAIPTWAIAAGLIVAGAMGIRRRRGAGGEAGDEREAAAAGRAAPVRGAVPALAFTRWLGLACVVLALATAERLGASGGWSAGTRPRGLEAGGYWGTFLAARMPRSLSVATGYTLLAVAGGIGLALGLDVDRRAVRVRAVAATGGARGAAAAQPPALQSGGARAEPQARPQPEPQLQPASRHQPTPAAEAEPALQPPGEPADAVVLASAEAEEAPPPPTGSCPSAAPSSSAVPSSSSSAAPLPFAASLPFAPPTPSPVPSAASSAVAGPIPAASASAEPPSAAGPPLRLLAPTIAAAAASADRAAGEGGRALVEALGDFRIEAEVVSIERGPNVTRYELSLAKGTKVNRVVGLEHDIQLALKARSVRIVAPIPGRATVGIEVPNQDQEVVRLRELIEAGIHEREAQAIPLFLGRDAAGAPLVADLARMPHLLIAGATGSGKSVCMNAIICSILAARAPTDVKLILIDPKMVELSLYGDVPHLLAPVVTDMRRAASVLEWAVEQMEARYALLQKAQVRHVKSWNALGEHGLGACFGYDRERLRQERIPIRMPYIVVVIDEFADLMCVARKEVEGSIIRLAQKSRAVGIHLILATQRPTADVITGLIKSNLPCRLAFQVASKLDSRTILDQSGAETLLGQGDMLWLPPGTSHTVRAQGAFVSDDEVKALCDHARGAGAPEYEGGLEDERPGALGSKEKDDLFDRAVEVILESGRASASLLQRRLEVGYSRASRLIDQMSDAGLLGPFKGSKAREILISLEDWKALQRSAAAG